jgi:hypothetical protein
VSIAEVITEEERPMIINMLSIVAILVVICFSALVCLGLVAKRLPEQSPTWLNQVILCVVFVVGVALPLWLLDAWGNSYRHDHGGQNLRCWQTYATSPEGPSLKEMQEFNTMTKENEGGGYDFERARAFELGGSFPCPTWSLWGRFVWAFSGGKTE